MTFATKPEYIQIINNFIFREIGSIKIPKSVREKAYQIAIDIEIVSIAKESYKNYRSYPSHSFYGYAILVMENYAQIKIPIELGRQRLFFDRIDYAFINHASLYWENNNANFHLANNAYLMAIGAALAIPPDAQIAECFSPIPWLESPIREIYIKCDFGTQFNIEISYWQPIEMQLDGCNYDGKSGQTEGDKDGGLPQNGIQPQVATDPENPYNGFPAPSSGSELGEFSNLDKLPNSSNSGLGIDFPNSDNSPSEGFSNCSLQINPTYKYLAGHPNESLNGQIFNASLIENIVVPRGSFFTVETRPNPSDTETTGQASAIKIMPSGLYFNGNIVNEFDPWTFHDLNLSAVCTPI